MRDVKIDSHEDTKDTKMLRERPKVGSSSGSGLSIGDGFTPDIHAAEIFFQVFKAALSDLGKTR